MTSIKQIQLGNQTYSLGQTELSQVSVKRGKPFITCSDNYGNDYLCGLLRPNEITTAYCLNSQIDSIIATGFPQEYIQESGKLVLFCDNYGILQDIQETIGTVDATKKLTILTDSYTVDHPSADSLCYPNNNNKIYKLVLYWNEGDLSTFAYRKVPLCGSNSEYQLCSDSWIQDIVSNMHEYDSMVIFWKDGEVYTKLCVLYSDYIDIYGGYGHEDQQSVVYTDEGYVIPNSQYALLYVGPAYREVQPVSHYLFNVIGQTYTLTTNIPLIWNQGMTPEFTNNSIVQISILDGIGSFTAINLEE